MQNIIITNSGRRLMVRLIEGEAKAAFTRIATSDHDYSEEDLSALTELDGVRQTAYASKVSKIDLSLVELTAALDNAELTEGYFVRALGVYAKDEEGAEVLYGVSIETENPDYLPPFSGKTVSSITYKMSIKVDNSDQVTVEVNPLAYATAEQAQAMEAALDGKVDKIPGKGLSANDYTDADREKLAGIRIATEEEVAAVCGALSLD